MALISKTTITADTPAPECHDYELTLKFKMSTYSEGPLDAATEEMLNHVLHDWRDGRHPFSVEMIDDGVRRCLRQAMSYAIEKEMQAKYGHEMVTSHEGRQKTSRWHIEAANACWKMVTPYIADEPKATITEVTECQNTKS